MDAKRAQKFTKLGKAITIAARLGGENPDFNPNLRLAIEKAKEFNMPKDRIINSIKKGSGKDPDNQLEEILYEALGPAGTMFLIETVTDKKNRTISELRKIMESFGGKMADGGVGWNFKRKGILLIESGEDQKENIFETAVLSGAEDVLEEESEGRIIISVLTEVEKFSAVKEALSEFEMRETKISYVPNNPQIFNEIEEKYQEKISCLMEELEDHPDVLELYSNVIF